MAGHGGPATGAGAVELGGEPNGPAMGKVVARRGHQVLLPKGAAYRMSAEAPAVVKAATLHGVSVRESAEGWTAQVILDV